MKLKLTVIDYNGGNVEVEIENIVSIALVNFDTFGRMLEYKTADGNGGGFRWIRIVSMEITQ